MRIFYTLLLFLLLLCLSSARAGVEDFYAIYSPLSERNIYGSIMVTKDQIKWVANADTYVCNAKYQVIENARSKIYPGKYGNREDADGTIYEYIRIQLFEKSCPENLPNIYIFNRDSSLLFAIPIDIGTKSYRHAKLISYSEDGALMGTSNYVHTKPNE